MKCFKCGAENPETSLRCNHCNTALDLAVTIGPKTSGRPTSGLADDEAPTYGAMTSGERLSRGLSVDETPTSVVGSQDRALEGWSRPGRDPRLDFGYLALQPGSVLGDRYEILQLLGEG